MLGDEARLSMLDEPSRLPVFLAKWASFAVLFMNGPVLLLTFFAAVLEDVSSCSEVPQYAYLNKVTMVASQHLQS